MEFLLLESSKNELKILTENRLKSDELIKTFEQNRIRLETELDVIKRDLEERNRDLKKDRIRIENMIRQEEVKNKLIQKLIFLFSFIQRIINLNNKYLQNHMMNYHKNVNYLSNNLLFK